MVGMIFLLMSPNAPNHPILIGCFIINHPFWGTPILETPICFQDCPFSGFADTPQNDALRPTGQVATGNKGWIFFPGKSS